jgi:hypothetical protein
VSVASTHDALELLSPALRRVLDDELKRGNRVVEVEVEGPFVQVLLGEPLALDAHQLPEALDRFRCAPRGPDEPPLAGLGDDESGHTLAGPDPALPSAAPTSEDAAAANRRLSSETPAAVEWHPDDSATVARLKRPAQRFKWKHPASIRAVRDLMLVLFALERDGEAKDIAAFLAERAFDDDAERWEPVESALGLLAHYARAAGDAGAAARLGDRLEAGGVDEVRREGALLADLRDNAELQPPGTGTRREWELRWLSELLVLSAVLGPDPVRAAAIEERKTALSETLG